MVFTMCFPISQGDPLLTIVLLWTKQVKLDSVVISEPVPTRLNPPLRIKDHLFDILELNDLSKVTFDP